MNFFPFSYILGNQIHMFMMSSSIKKIEITRIFVQEIVRVKGDEKYYSSSKVYDTPAHLSQALT
jgi:hypothetical protein